MNFGKYIWGGYSYYPLATFSLLLCCLWGTKHAFVSSCVQSFYICSLCTECPITFLFWRSDCFFSNDGWIWAASHPRQKGSPKGFTKWKAFLDRRREWDKYFISLKKKSFKPGLFFFFFGTSRWIFVLKWSIIVLQCYISFYYTIRWISYMYKYIPSLSLPFFKISMY